VRARLALVATIWIAAMLGGIALAYAVARGS
jgi:hypothetical protein